MMVSDRLRSGRAATEHKYALGSFFFFFLHVSLYASNHFNHCIKLFILILIRSGNYVLSICLYFLFFLVTIIYKCILIHTEPRQLLPTS